MSRFETALFGYFNQFKNYLRVLPLNLGGISASGGGSGGPPGGFTGYLPQTRVSYDLTEAGLEDFVEPGAYTASGVLVSGSLLDNLNHIRYRIEVLESGGISGQISVYDDTILISSGITAIDFGNNLDVTDEGGGLVTVDYNGITVLDDLSDVNTPSPSDGQVLTYNGAQWIASGVTLTSSGLVLQSGIYGENLTSQIPGSGNHYSINHALVSGTLAVYYNGIRQNPEYFIVDDDEDGFTTTFTLVSGDALIVDYTTSGSAIAGHSHITNLSELEDVSISTPADGEVLTYNGAQWVASGVTGGGGGGILAAFSAYPSANTIPGNDTYVKVSVNTETFDIGNYFDSLTNYRWTPPAGVAQINFIGQTSNTNTDGFAILVYKNGSSFKKAIHRISTGYNQSLTIPFTDQCNGIDYYEFYCWRWSAGQLDGNDATATVVNGVCFDV